MDSATTYDLKVVLRGISPMVWRRLRLVATTTITDLHHILQIALAWEDIHLHRFHIYGKDYGVSHDGGMSFADNPDQIRLDDFAFRVGERFWYEYDFFAHWMHDIRVEQILPAISTSGPACIGGARAAPPEDCGGAWPFLELRQQYSLPHLLTRFAELMTADPPDREQLLRELPTIAYWLNVDRFHRRRVNQRLAQYAAGNQDWMEK
jgi:hypothetical protein